MYSCHWIDKIAGKAFALHLTKLALIPDTSLIFPALLSMTPECRAKSNPTHSWVYHHPKIKKASKPNQNKIPYMSKSVYEYMT